jgi:predicted glutamine amidotransferase
VCRLLGYCAADHVSLADLLGPEALADFTALSCMHGDGWGMGWYPGGEPVIEKSVRQASAEERFGELTRQPLGGLGLVHLRWATPGLPVASANTHPFRYGHYLLAHNGAIHPQDRLPQLLPPAWERQVTGSTDSERYFLHLMWRLAERDGDMMAAIGDTTADIASRFAPGSLNAILLAPDALYAISWHDPDRIPRDALRRRGLATRPDDVEAYFDLTYRAGPDAVVVASSGWPMPGWAPLPRGHVLTVDRATLAATVTPIPALAPVASPVG